MRMLRDEYDRSQSVGRTRTCSAWTQLPSIDPRDRQDDGDFARLHDGAGETAIRDLATQRTCRAPPSIASSTRWTRMAVGTRRRGRLPPRTPACSRGVPGGRRGRPCWNWRGRGLRRLAERDGRDGEDLGGRGRSALVRRHRAGQPGLCLDAADSRANTFR